MTGAEAGAGLRRSLGLRDLVLFNIAAVAGIRWLAAAAHAGPGSITLWLLAALFFFVPSALVVAALSSRIPEQGGLYVWTRRSFGDWHAFLCGWCYWQNNLFYLPSLLLAGAGMALYTAGDAYAGLSESRWFLLPASLVVLWAALLANLFGLGKGKWIGNLGGLATYAAGLLLIAAGVLVWMKHGSATAIDITPSWDWQRINFWSQIAFAFGGLELGAVLGGEIRDPERTVRRAAWISGLGIVFFYLAGTLALLVILPPDRISILTGLAQSGAEASALLGWQGFGAALALLITLGVAGQLSAWIAGCARLPYVIGLEGYLPRSFGALHPRWRTPHVALLAQGAFCTAVLVLTQVGENLRGGYQMLVDLAVITYFIPFLYIFAAGWKAGLRAVSGCGMAVTSLAIGVSLAPPGGAVSGWWFSVKLLAVTALLIGAARIWFDRCRARLHQA